MISVIRVLANKVSFSFAAVRRLANQVANWIAKHALLIGSWIFRLGNVPNNFLVLVCEDISSLFVLPVFASF